MIAIDINKNVDWTNIKNEYITTEISQRQLAIKHGVSVSTLSLHARREGWVQLREDFIKKAEAKLLHKIANEKAQTVIVAERVRRKLLLQLEQELDEAARLKFSNDSLVKEVKETDTGKKTISNHTRKRNLVDTYKDLIDEDFRREKLQIERAKLDDDW